MSSEIKAELRLIREKCPIVWGMKEVCPSHYGLEDYYESYFVDEFGNKIQDCDSYCKECWDKAIEEESK